MRVLNLWFNRQSPARGPLALAFGALLAASGCDEDESAQQGDGGQHEVPADSGPAQRDGGVRDGGPGYDCALEVAGSAGELVFPALAQETAPLLSWTGGNHVVAAWPAADGRGYRWTDLFPVPAPLGDVRTVWAQQTAGTAPRMTTLGVTHALVDLTAEGAGTNARRSCRLGLIAPGESSSPALMAVSAGDGSGSAGDAAECSVVPFGDLYLVLWKESAGGESSPWHVYARAFRERDGTFDARRTIAGPISGQLRALAAASNGPRALIVYSIAGEPRSHATRIDAASESAQSFELPFQPRELLAFDDGFLALTERELWRLDRDGAPRSGPTPIAAHGQAAALGDGYVLIEAGERLQATAIDAELDARSAPLTLSAERGARVEALASSPDGSFTGVLYRERGALRYAELRCQREPAQPPPPPDGCPAQAAPPGLEDGCSDEVCHVAIRLDYLSLAPRGWAVAGGPFAPVDADQALAIARDAIHARGEDESLLWSEAKVGAANGGVFTVSVEPLDFGAVALIGEDSGAVIMAGGVVYLGSGGYWLPEAWRPASEIACGSEPVVPTAVHLDPDSCGTSQRPSRPPPTAQQALDLALRSNLAAAFAARGAFSAHVHQYTPAVGECNPMVAEYVVVLSQPRWSL